MRAQASGKEGPSVRPFAVGPLVICWGPISSLPVIQRRTGVYIRSRVRTRATYYLPIAPRLWRAEKDGASGTLSRWPGPPISREREREEEPLTVFSHIPGLLSSPFLFSPAPPPRFFRPFFAIHVSREVCARVHIRAYMCSSVRRRGERLPICACRGKRALNSLSLSPSFSLSLSLRDCASSYLYIYTHTHACTLSLAYNAYKRIYTWPTCRRRSFSPRFRENVFLTAALASAAREYI